MPDAVGPIDATSSNRISSRELRLLAQSRSKSKFAALSSEERGAYSRIHAVLERLGVVAVDALGGPGEFAAKLTSGFHPGSGVRGSLPKDLWCAAYNRRNLEAFVGMPQVFVIVSARGLEIGLAATLFS
jgi:hypothetical protein